MKKCVKCKLAPAYRRSYCKSCQLLHQKDWYEKNHERELSKRNATKKQRREEIRAFLDLVKSAPCVDCGVQYPPYVMDFDHRDPSLKRCAVSQIRRMGSTIEALKKEITKCDLVCSNCHRIRTFRGSITQLAE